MPRLFAALIALVAWAALGIQFYATFSSNGSLPETIWILLRFFTVITNLLVAIIMTAVAMDRRVSPFLIGGSAVAIGARRHRLYNAPARAGGARRARICSPTPCFTTSCRSQWCYIGWPSLRSSVCAGTHPFLWSLYPLAYFGYAVARGSIDGRYPYPFMDVAELGATQTMLNAACDCRGVRDRGTFDGRVQPPHRT